MLDMHCHVLYGVDDGSRDKNESLEMLKAAKKCGINRIVFTPHLYNTRHDLTKVFNRYQEVAEMANELGIKVKQGFEVNWRVLDEVTLDQLGKYRIEGTDSILLELPERSLIPEWQQVILRLVRRYNIIIAHPERYRYVQLNLDMVKTFIECGCEIAVDASGMSANLLSDERKLANLIVKYGMANYIVSDAHRVEHYKYYQKHSPKAKKLTKGALYDDILWA